MKNLAALLLAVIGLLLVPASLSGAEPPAPTDQERIADLEAYMTNGARSENSLLNNVPGPGHNAWLMVSAALVLFMTLPGLALFYGGLVRRKNVLSVIAQCFGCAGLVTILWFLFGYSLVFSEGTNPVIGTFKHAFLDGVTSAPNTTYGGWVSGNVFAMFQMMFAIITPALIVGAIAERMKFSAILLFVGLWMVIVYFPLAHMVWGSNGLMNGVWNGEASIRTIDFAGGTVVHMSSGWSALVLCLLLGKRVGFGKDVMSPHSMVLCAVGTGMLWVGWFGFNAGSAVAADGIAANAFTTTMIAAAVGSFVWPMLEWMLRGKPSILGFCSGVIAGLVVITPAAGFVTPKAAFLMGALGAACTFFACTKLKQMFGYDDSLDTFGIHGVGGTLGALLTGFFASAEVNEALGINLGDVVGKTLWIEQIKAIVLTIVLSVVATLAIACVVRATVGLRPSEDVERQGLDLAEHGEEGYHG